MTSVVAFPLKPPIRQIFTILSGKHSASLLKEGNTYFIGIGNTGPEFWIKKNENPPS